MMRRSRLILRLLLLIALVLAIFLAVSTYLYRSTPSYYRPRRMTAAQSAAAAEVAEAQVISLRNWAEHQRAINSARRHGVATQSVGPIRVRATDQQINAFFQKYKSVVDWDQTVDPYVSDITLAIVNGQIVFSGDVKDLHAILSVVFTVQLDNQGRLIGQIQRVLAGRLTLPPPIWNAQRRRVINALRQAIADCRQDAHTDPTGTANLAAIAAAMGQTLLNAINDQPSDPIIFVPVDQNGGIPARISALSVGDGEITMTLDPISLAQRTAWSRGR